QSFRQAVKEDSHFVAGYIELARLAAEQKQWNELVEVTNRLVQFSPEASAEPWFLNAAANYNLGNIKQAEASVARAARLDTHHEIPQIEHLYGLVLASNHDFNAAAEHLSAYLRLAPGAADAAAARSKLSELQNLAESSPSPGR